MKKNRLGITEGEVYICDMDIVLKNGNSICQVYDGKDSSILRQNMDIVESNAKLIADAFNTANKCGLLPSELLEQRDELLKVIKDVRILHGYSYDNPINIILDTAINKIEQQTKTNE